MCVIIDACVRDEFFTSTPSPAANVVRRWILERGGKVVYGGKLTKELQESPRARKELTNWLRSGRALLYPQSRVETVTASVQRMRLCVSNDAHVIALARLSGARVLFSRDRSGLHEDFKNPSLIDDPRGSVFQEPDHEHLLRHHSSCRNGQGTIGRSSPH